MKLVNDVLAGNRMLVMVASKDPEAENPGPDQIYRVGVAGFVARMLKVPDGSLRILVQGGRRVELTDFVATEPYMVARIEPRPDVVEEGTETELEALARNVQGTFSQIISEVPYLPEELQLAVANLEDPTELAHMIAGSLRLSTEEKQELLEELDVAKRLRRLSELLARELELISIGSRIQSQVQSEMEKGQREYFLRQQLKAIQDELGEVDEQTAEANELREQIEAAGLPELRAEGGRARARPAREAAAAGGRARGDPHLPRVARDAAVVEVHRRRPRPEEGAPRARPRPLRHRQGQGAHPRVPGGPQAEAGRAVVGALLRRACRASARRRWGGRSRRRWGASSSASPSAACATSPRSAVIAAPTSARCPARSSARCATPSRTTRC